MTKKGIFTDRRWHDPPTVVCLGHSGSSKNDSLSFAKLMFEKGHITKERYQEKLVEIEKKYKGRDPDELI